jgi:GNAT superfamily N-acetyltransferase
MTSRELFQRYVDERKTAALPGYRRDTVAGLTRYTPVAPDLDGLVMFSELDESSLGAAIQQQTEYFARLGRGFEWKVHAFDSPANLAARLEGQGFEPDPVEALMVYGVSGHAARDRDVALRIERVTTPAGVRDILAVQEKIWGRAFPWLESWLHALLPRAALFCAYDGDEPIGTGWIEFPPGATFAELHGGSVLAEHRGRGIYSMLFDARVEEAKRHGIEFLAVDAAPMSRPILLAKGFTYVCDTTPYRKRAALRA